MLRKRSFFVFPFLFLFAAHTSFAGSCKNEKRFLILPLKFSKNKKTPSEDPRAILGILMKDYLSLVKGVSANYILSGEIAQNGKQFKLISHIDSTKHQEIFRFEGEFEFPKTMNGMLLNYVEKASAVLGKKLSQKEILPFLNVSSSAVAYQKYAAGRIALMHGSWGEAAAIFEEAIKNDYNYVPAYVGLSDSLAQQSSTKTNPRTEVEWQKAQLLNPVLSKKIKELDLCP